MTSLQAVVTDWLLRQHLLGTVPKLAVADGGGARFHLYQLECPAAFQARVFNLPTVNHGRCCPHFAAQTLQLAAGAMAPFTLKKAALLAASRVQVVSESVGTFAQLLNPLCRPWWGLIGPPEPSRPQWPYDALETIKFSSFERERCHRTI